jgi:hypothetical protein
MILAGWKDRYGFVGVPGATVIEGSDQKSVTGIRMPQATVTGKKGHQLAASELLHGDF